MSAKDELSRFVIESADVRGSRVHLDDTWASALAQVDYPPVIRNVLGQAFAASVLLSATIKFAGKMTLQIRGDGPVHLLVVQITADRKLRGLARWKSEPVDDSLQSMFGENARMSLTIGSTENRQPYQSIVALDGASLSDALAGYFRHSEQLDTCLMLAVNSQQVAGFLLQKLPGYGDDADGWRRSLQLASTLTDDDLLNLDTEDILRRLYHEENVRLFRSDPVAFECSCSQARSASLIQSLGVAEAESILQDEGQIEITCEFCDAKYRYDSIDVAALFTDSGTSGGDGTVH